MTLTQTKRYVLAQIKRSEESIVNMEKKREHESKKREGMIAGGMSPDEADRNIKLLDDYCVRNIAEHQAKVRMHRKDLAEAEQLVG